MLVDDVTQFDGAVFADAAFAALLLKGGGKAVVKEQRASLLNSVELYVSLEVLLQFERHPLISQSPVQVTGPEAGLCRVRAGALEDALVGGYKVMRFIFSILQSN